MVGTTDQAPRFPEAALQVEREKEMETLRQQATDEAVRSAVIKVTEQFEKEQVSNENFKEEVEANIGSLLEATLAKLNKLETNNAASEAEIKKHAGDIQVLTGVITKSTTVAVALETRFQSVEANVGKILVQMQGFSQNMTSIQNQLSIMAPGNFPLQAHPGYLGAPPSGSLHTHYRRGLPRVQ